MISSCILAQGITLLLACINSASGLKSTITIMFSDHDFLKDGYISYIRVIGPTHIPVVSIVRLSIPDLWLTQSVHISLTLNSDCACAVSCDFKPGKKCHIFDIEPSGIWALVDLLVGIYLNFVRKELFVSPFRFLMVDLLGCLLDYL